MRQYGSVAGEAGHIGSGPLVQTLLAEYALQSGPESNLRPPPADECRRDVDGLFVKWPAAFEIFHALKRR